LGLPTFLRAALTPAPTKTTCGPTSRVFTPLTTHDQPTTNMARVLIILSIIIGLGSAFLGWKIKEQADALQSDLKTTKNTLATTKQTLKKTEAELTETKTTLETTQATLKKTEEDLTNAKGELATAKADMEKLKADIEAKDKQIAEIDAKMKELKETIGDIDLASVPGKLAELTATKAKLETELAEAKQVQESLNQRVAGLEGEVQTKESTIVAYKNKLVQPGLTGRILAYNPGWNFVVLSIGDKAGLKSGVNMVVTRGGAMIGKVKVTTVEPNTAIADVLPGTLAKGESVQPGDSVIYEGKR
jgi:septal ring factor EnvC (AmiA/AmiB activator)